MKEARSHRSWRTPLLGVAILAVPLAGGAVAASQKPGIHPVSRSHAGATALASVIMDDKSQLLGATFVTAPPNNHPNAISNQRITFDGGKKGAFPRRGHSYAVLTNGCSNLVTKKKGAGRPGCRDGGVRTRGAHDVTILRIGVRAPQGSNCLSFRFRFFSQEYPEFVGSQFNDAFIAELDHSTWKADGTPVTAPRNFAKTRFGSITSVNNAGPAVMRAFNARGTTYGGATRVLRASTRIKPGKHNLYLSIFDQGDRQYDSAVFVDHLAIVHKASCKPGLSKF